MSILEMAEIVLTEKLERTYTDTIDIRLTREQALDLCETIHRIVTYEKNMRGSE